MTECSKEFLEEYDYILIAFSGGKDSLACVLHLLDQGVDRSKIQLHHHCVDGNPKTDPLFMDWPETHEYCEKFAEAMDLPIWFSWKCGGFKTEMCRDEEPTAAIEVMEPDGLIRTFEAKGKPGTRLKFPQVSGNLSVRWCSAYLKIDVMSHVINNTTMYNGKRLLVVTGERAQESPNRAKYAVLEPHRCSNKRRHVDQYRPIHAWQEEQVWEIIEKHKINPHPAYQYGWGRLSCMKCIFGSPNQWASVRVMDPKGFDEIHSYEKKFDTTIHRTRSIAENADRGQPYESLALKMATAPSMDNFQIKVDEWKLPTGAYGESAGPT